MKNLKRVLSLALATVMVIGMMVVGANATFADQTDIDYTAAVDMLTGLGVLNGMGDNKFVPDGTVTRAQAAKMVAYVKAGANETTVGYYAGATKFTDVKANHSWAAGSINYCVSLGIIAGRSATTYDPDGNVTGAELAKMMLVALGYSASTDDATTTLTGGNWQLNAIRMATETGLFNGLNSSFVATKAATRQEAAQIVYNALNADTWIISGKDSNGNYIYKTGASLLETCFAVEKVTGVVTANTATGVAGTTVKTKDGDVVFLAETGLDMIGHSVTVLEKVDSSKKAITDKKTGLVLSYGIIDNATKVATVVATGTAGKADLEADAKAAGFSAVSKKYADGAKVYGNYDLSKDLTSTGYKNGLTTILISNTDKKTVDTVIQVVQTLEQVTALKTVTKDGDTTTTYTLSNGSVVTSTDASKVTGTVTGTVAKDDFVIATKVGAKLTNIETAKTVTGTVTAVTTTAATKVTTYTVNGTAYTKSVVENKSGKLGAVTDLKSGAEVVLYLDASGNVIAQDGVKATNNWAYVATARVEKGVDANGFETGKNTVKAVIYLADGTNAVYTVAIPEKSNAEATAASLKSGVLAQVAFDKDGAAVVTTSATDLKDSVTSVIKGVSKLGDNIYANNNTAFFFVKGAYGDKDFSVSVVTGMDKIASKTTLAHAYGTVTAGAPTIVNAALVTSAYETGEATQDLVYYNGEYTTTETATSKTVTYVIYKGSEKAEVSFALADKAEPVKAAGFYTVGAKTLEDNAKNVVKEDTVAAFFGGTLTLTTTKDVQVTDKTAVVDLSKDGNYTSLSDADNTLKVAVSYTVDAATNVKTATTIYVLTVTAK